MIKYPETFPEIETLNPLNSKTEIPNRVVRHRKAVSGSGGKRVEVTVPANDAGLIKAIAGALRSGGKRARMVRKSLQPILTIPKARTGKELIEFLRRSPLADIALDFERDRSTGRSADFD